MTVIKTLDNELNHSIRAVLSSVPCGTTSSDIRRNLEHDIEKKMVGGQTCRQTNKQIYGSDRQTDIHTYRQT